MIKLLNRWHLVGFMGLLLCVLFFISYVMKSNKPKTIKFFASHGPVEVITKPLEIFKNEVESRTEGRIKVELIVSEEAQNHNLRIEKKVLQDVQANVYQMSQLYSKSLVQFEKDFSVLEVPYLFKDHEHSFATVDGEVGKDLLAKLENNSNLKGLGYTYSGGYRFISTKSKMIRKMEDFVGLKIATGTEASTKILKKLGVVPQENIDKLEIRNRVGKDSVDGMVTVYPRYFYNNDYKIAPIANELFFNIQFTVLTINKDFFNSISKEDQKVIVDSAQRISVMERKIAIEIAEDVNKNSKEHGITIVKMDPQESKKMIEKLTRIDWTKELNISPGLIDKIKSISTLKITNL
ncbi:MAG: TRAP transporter substrate-binding protein [Pseudobdellovibrio sp.]